MKPISVLIESGKKRTFASALDWPGWSRNGKEEESALQALVDYGARYAQIVQPAQLDFQPPADTAGLTVVERSEGDATTDFGAPSIPALAESEPLDLAEFKRVKTLLRACWQAFDRVVQRAEGKELRKGPRGGGRDVDKILQHVIGSDQGYLRSLGWRPEKGKHMEGDLQGTREAVLDTLERAVKEGLPEHGPRGGKIWPARYFVRRLAWHLLDHAWGIEDRIVSPIP
jgi:hypothetical protein